jgi:hypothetical protein
LVFELCSLSEILKITQNLGNLMFCIPICEGGEREVVAALGPMERGLLCHRTGYTSLTIHREMVVWDTTVIYTTQT